jgi:hypothetical protein
MVHTVHGEEARSVFYLTHPRYPKGAKRRKQFEEHTLEETDMH